MKTIHKPYGIYEKYFKRLFDLLCSLLSIAVFWWLYLIVAILVKVKLGSPVLFMQDRPGKDEKIFRLYKFRTMIDARDEKGDFFPDEIRITSFGKMLRASSLDELPEVFNIIKGDMSIIGPRPQLVRDMVFMTKEQRRRHQVRPGLSGLAQINGRNAITWENKFLWDLKYIDKITFLGDMKIIFKTIEKVFKKADINREDTVSDMDFGYYLLHKGEVTKEEYDKRQEEAKKIIEKIQRNN